MKKTVCVICLVLLMLSLSSCSSPVTYIKAPADNDADFFKKINEVKAEGSDEAVFYSYKTIYDVSVNVMDYNEQKDEYSVKETLFETPVLDGLNAIKVTLDLSKEMPYVMIRYSMENGETREQYIYKSPSDQKYWLLERE